MTFVEELISVKPAYLDIAPNFATVFNGLKKHNPHYIAHEYLNLDWELMYFTDVVEMFQAHKMDFATTALPIEAIETFGFPPEAQAFLNKIGNPIMREQVRDYFVNRQFRKDLFVRGLRRVSRFESQQKLLETRYVLQMPAKDVPLKFTRASGEVSLSEEFYRPLLEFFQADNFRPKTFVEYLQRHPELKPSAMVEAATFLVDANQIMPCQSEAAVKRVKKSCERLNAYLCERAKVDESIKFLASPLTGCGHSLNRFQQLFLALHKSGERAADKLAQSVWEILSRQGQQIIHEDKRLETPEENLRHLKIMAQNFLTNELPIFKALQL